MTQTTQEKAAAIASVLWLLEDHHRMIAMGRVTRPAQWISSGAQEGYRPPIVVPLDPHDPNYPDEAFILRQRRVSKAYRLWPISLKLQKLWREHPSWAQAVESLYVNLPPTTWIDPDRYKRMARLGLDWLAKRVPGDVPTYAPAPTAWRDSRDDDILRERLAGAKPQELASKWGVSARHVRRICAAVKVRLQRT